MKTQLVASSRSQAMKKKTAKEVFAAYWERQVNRDRAGHISHIECTCPRETTETWELIDKACHVLTDAEKRVLIAQARGEPR